MRVLVTGGAGYIGSVVTDDLIDAGHDVIVLDDLSTGHRDAVNEKATFVRGSILDRIPARALDDRVDAVVHMAARSIIGDSPELTRRDNVDGSQNLLDAMKQAGTKMLVFSSTASVYGDPPKQPIEEDDPLRPVNVYGETKLEVERRIERSGLRFVSLRYFNAAGATEKRSERHDPETHLIPLVLRGSVTIHGSDHPTPDGTCIRDFVHVADLARAHVLAMEALASGRPSATYNLGGGEGHSVREVIRTVERVTGRSIAVTIGPRRPGDPAKLVASARKIERELGWRPLHDLERMIRDASR